MENNWLQTQFSPTFDSIFLRMWHTLKLWCDKKRPRSIHLLICAILLPEGKLLQKCEMSQKISLVKLAERSFIFLLLGHVFWKGAKSGAKVSLTPPAIFVKFTPHAILFNGFGLVWMTWFQIISSSLARNMKPKRPNSRPHIPFSRLWFFFLSNFSSHFYGDTFPAYSWHRVNVVPSKLYT